MSRRTSTTESSSTLIRYLLALLSCWALISLAHCATAATIQQLDHEQRHMEVVLDDSPWTWLANGTVARGILAEAVACYRDPSIYPSIHLSIYLS